MIEINKLTHKTNDLENKLEKCSQYQQDLTNLSEKVNILENKIAEQNATIVASSETRDLHINLDEPIKQIENSEKFEVYGKKIPNLSGEENEEQSKIVQNCNTIANKMKDKNPITVTISAKQIKNSQKCEAKSTKSVHI